MPELKEAAGAHGAAPAGSCNGRQQTLSWHAMPCCPLRAVGLSLLLYTTAAASGSDAWPQFLGPTRDGVYSGEDLAASWPAAGPKVLWSYSVGQGLAGPVTADGRVIVFHRKGETEVVECLDALDGTKRWDFSYPSHYSNSIGTDDSGPRATPALAGGKAYTLGAEGMIHAVDLETGKRVWSVDARAEYGADLGYFGLACSPLVDGGRVLLNIGGRSGAGIVALDAGTGKLVWKATDDAASYSSPTLGTVLGSKAAVFFTRSGLRILDPESGAVRFSLPWRARSNTTVNAATPLFVGDAIFLSASYGTGAVLLTLKDGGVVEKIWSSDDALSNHYSTSVLYHGDLIGFDGRQEGGASLRCVEATTGKVRWSKERFGCGTVTLAKDRLLVLTEEGDLLLAPASPTDFVPVAKASLADGTVRAYPALASGRLYARGERKLVCLDLRKKSP
jgi:outer membrane protein assembly factor BamB